MKKFLAACLFFIVLPGLAHAEIEAKGLLKLYEEGTPERRKFWETVVAQNYNGISWANSYLKQVRKDKAIFCVPSNFVPTGSQIMDMLRRENDPQVDALPFGMAIIVVFQKTFPCSDQ